MAQDHQPPAIITLTTDFGAGSRYVGAMKGVILSINPRAHDCRSCRMPFRRAIFGPARSCWPKRPCWFPPGTIQLRSSTRASAANGGSSTPKSATQHFVAPDNGLLSRLAMSERPSKMVSVDEPRHWMPDVSRTFHGRDIMAPVAARLSLGLAPEELGRPQQQLVEIPWAEVEQVSNRIEGEVIEVDSFGNLITNITRAMLDGLPNRDAVLVTCEEHETQGIFATFSDQPPMTFMAHVGSTGRLELAIVDENASAMLGVKVGAPVRVTW